MPSKPTHQAPAPPESPERDATQTEHTRAVVAAAEQAVINEQEALESGEENPG